MQSPLPLRLLGAAVIAGLPVLALAHPGPDGGAHHGWLAGFLHPFTGIDHLAAMLAVGAWSGLTAQRAWLAPAAFVAMLLVGALLAAAGVVVPAVEAMIALSLVVLGGLLALRIGLGHAAGVLLVGGLALFHGAAHGLELAGSASALAGMVAGTVVLHVAGVGLGRAIRAQAHRAADWSGRIAGGVVAGFGALLVVPGLFGG